MAEDKKQAVTIVNKKLKITLKSDLCAGSGFAYAGIVDTDVSYNKNGIPFISGRSLKGCMREAAEMIGIAREDITAVFGISGNDRASGIFVGNAFPKEFGNIKNELSILQEGRDRYAEYLKKQNILELCTSVKAQTKIGENGVAKDNTLRFTRTIHQFDKIQKKEMVFEASLSYQYSEEEDPIEKSLEKIVKATRNIGMNRNRGLGSVRMELTEGEKQEMVSIDDSSKGTGKKKISYCITNLQPLLMSGSRDSVTENYISGTSVLGAFAGEYLKTGSADSEEFRDIFLAGKVIFSNLTLAEKHGETWEAAYPAPLYINRLKKTKKLVNLAADIPKPVADSDYSPENGNQPKKLKTQYLFCHDEKYDVKEVEKEIIYHHSKHGKSGNGEEGILYFLEAIAENQHFCGEIIVENKYFEKIKELLKTVELRFGKSKSAQYGKCRIEEGSVKVTDYQTEKVAGLKKGSRILVTLLSDGIFVNEKGIYTIQHEEVRKIIAQQMGFSVSMPDEKTYIQTKVLTGFYTKWNLKKQEIPAIAAGSAFEYCLEEEISEYEEYIGEKNLEGFGKCRMVPLEDAKYCLEMMEERDCTEKEKKEMIQKCGQEKKTQIEQILQKILLEKLAVHMKEKAFAYDEIKISSSALGRLHLMLIEAGNEADSAIEKYVLLRKRIASIKSRDTQETIMQFLGNVLGKDVFTDTGEEGIWEDTEKRSCQQKNIVDTIKKNTEGKTMEEYEFLHENFGEEEIEPMVFELWSGYLNDVLVRQKYLKA